MSNVTGKKRTFYDSESSQSHVNLVNNGQTSVYNQQNINKAQLFAGPTTGNLHDRGCYSLGSMNQLGHASATGFNGTSHVNRNTVDFDRFNVRPPHRSIASGMNLYPGKSKTGRSAMIGFKTNSMLRHIFNQNSNCNYYSGCDANNQWDYDNSIHGKCNDFEVQHRSGMTGCDNNSVSYTREEVAENVYILSKFIKQMPKKENYIQNIENAVTGSKIDIYPTYTDSILEFSSHESMYTGAIYLAEAFLARGVSDTKKRTKHETYRSAYEVLTGKRIVDILQLKDPGIDAVKQELSLSFGEETTGYSDDRYTLKQESLAMKMLKVKENIEHYGMYSNNPTTLIEYHLNKHGIKIQSSVDFETIYTDNGFYFIAELKFNDILIATGEGMSKKCSKEAAYQRAYDYITTKSPNEIARGSGFKANNDIRSPPPNNKANNSCETFSDQEEELSFENTTIVEEERRENLPSQLSSILSKVREAEPPENYTNTLDVYLTEANLRMVVLVKQLSYSIHRPAHANMTKNKPCCATLYVSCIAIASAKGNNKEDAQEACYREAWEVFCTYPVSHIIQAFEQHDPMEDRSSTLIDIIIKGDGKFGESNIQRLIAMNAKVFQRWKTSSELVIVETPELVTDRKANAFAILNYSASLSGMLLEWRYEQRTTATGDIVYGCRVRLQREDLGQAVMTSPVEARNEACLNPLRKLYFSQPAIHKLNLTTNDIKNCMTWDQLHKAVTSWTPEAEQVSGEGRLFSYIVHLSQAAEERMAGSLVLGVSGGSISPDYISTECGPDFNSKHDFPDEFKNELHQIMNGKGWRLESKKTSRGSYTLINAYQDVHKIAAKLEQHPKGIVCQYKLLNLMHIPHDFW